jgi:hypothetical protein
MRETFRLSLRLIFIAIVLGLISFGGILELGAEDESVDKIRLQAEQGDVEAQFRLGLMYYIGNVSKEIKEKLKLPSEGVTRDIKEAVKWLRNAPVLT